MQTQLREYGSDSQSTAHKNNLVALFKMRGHSQRADEVNHRFTFREIHHLIGSFSNSLNDNGNRALVTIKIGNGKGDTLPSFVDAHHDKVTRLAGPGYLWSHHFPQERRGIFRYLVVGHAGGFNHPGIGNIYDTTYIPDYINKENPLTALELFIKRGIRLSSRGQHVALAAVTMHELGHSCGLSNVDFEGIDNMTHRSWLFPSEVWQNTYIDYRSVMSYYAMYDPSVLSYSDGSNGPPYDQND